MEVHWSLRMSAVRCLTGCRYSHISTWKQWYYHLRQLLQFREPNPPSLKPGFLALSALRHSHLIRGCAAEPQNFQYMNTYYGLIAGGPDHGLTHHHLLSCELWRYLPDCFSCCWLCCHIIQFPNGHHNTCVFCKKPSSAFSPHLEWNPNSLSKFIEH